MGRSLVDQKMINAIRRTDGEVNANSLMDIQPSLGDVITWDGTSYSYIMLAQELLSKTGCSITKADGGSFNWRYVEKSASIVSSNLTVEQQATVDAKLGGYGLSASTTRSIGWTFNHSEKDSTIFLCGTDGSDTIGNFEDVMDAVRIYYKEEKGWEHDHWGIVDTVFYSSYCMLDYSQSKSTVTTIAATAGIDASLPIPESPGQADIGGDAAMGFITLSQSDKDSLTIWPNDGDLATLASETFTPLVVGWKMTRLSKDLGVRGKWAP